RLGPSATAFAGDGAPHRLEIEPDGERGALGGDDDGPHLVVVGDVLHHLGQVRPQSRAHRVATIGAVEPEGGDVSVALEGEDSGGARHPGMVGLGVWIWPWPRCSSTSTAR